MRVILVPVADRPECTKALNTAFVLADRVDASVVGCHIRPHRDSIVAMPTDFGVLADYRSVWDIQTEGKHAEKQSAAARNLFGSVAEARGFPLVKKPSKDECAMWTEKVGSPDRVLSILGPVADMTVVSRPNSKGGDVARMFLLSALMHTNRPVLVLPQSVSSAIGKRISIAWNGSAEAAQAVAAAMPLLREADEVNILVVGRESGVLGPKAKQLADYLKFWGVRSRRVPCDGKSDANALLNGYRETRSDLLVMGAYSHSRLRQRILGGVTEHMLHKANIPVFMLHA